MTTTSNSFGHRLAAGLVPSWLPPSVRTRLLVAFAVLFLSSMVLALVGWFGMRNTQEALSDFQRHVLPDVTRSLELSQRTAAIAAMAPYVAESTLPFQLQAEALALRKRLRDAELIAASLPKAGSREFDVEPALSSLRASIEELIEVTRKDLFLQEDLREYLYRLESARDSLDSEGANISVIDGILRDSATATSVSDPRLLQALRERVAGEISRMGRSNVGSRRVINLVRDNLEGPDNVFDLRARHFELQDRKNFLVTRTRAEAERLSERVDAYVSDARNRVEQQGGSIKRSVDSGIVGIVVLTMVCVVMASLGVWVVVRLVGSLGAITRQMSRLAQGDTGQSTLETSRPDELGALARAFEVFRDNALTARRMANEMQEQSDLLATVFESMKDGLSVFDRDGRLIAWNQQYPVLLKLPVGFLSLGMTLEKIQAFMSGQFHHGGALPSSPSPSSAIGDLNFARQDMPFRFEMVFSGGRVVEFRSNPMPGGGFVTLYSDLTERRAVEMQLRQAQKMEVLGQLTGGVAHDFNNLLAAITGNLYLLEESGELSERGERFAGRARAASERGAALTRRLLAFASRQPLSPTAVEIDALVRELSDLIDYSVGQGVALELDLQAPATYVWVDRGQLENALLNLAINARDAMPQGGELTIRTRVVDETVSIDVVDTGLGMDEETQERVFEPFFTTKGGSGSGLGLSIVYGFVRQSAGEITLSSVVGKGTTFTLRLPTCHVDPGEQTKTAPENPEKLIGLSVLLVEDNPDVRASVSDLLVASGHAVTVAKSAHEALHSLAEREPSFILSDVDFGGDTSGVQLMREVAKLHPHLPRILMSGLPAEILASRFGLTEDLPLLSKPFTVRQLDEAIREAMALCEETNS